MRLHPRRQIAVAFVNGARYFPHPCPTCTLHNIACPWLLFNQRDTVLNAAKPPAATSLHIRSCSSQLALTVGIMHVHSMHYGSQQ